MTARDTLIVGGGKSVFEDIGIPMSPTDLLRASLAAFISKQIQARTMTQAEAAHVLGIDQPKVSKLLRGRLKEFSVERLLGFVLRLGHSVDVQIVDSNGGDGQIKVAA